MSAIDVLNKILGDPNERELKKMLPLVKQVRDLQLSEEFQKMKEEDLPKKTEKLKNRFKNGKTLEDLLPEAFALVNRACELIQGKTTKIGAQEFVWDMVPYDVQIQGGIALHRGTIAEMKTGEGKTLVCTMPVYLNALSAKGVHVITVNDYLAKRDAAWMGMLYQALGMTVGTIVHGLDFEERKAAYAADITYGTNNEFGFDYLRDNMASSLNQQVQRGLNYAIVDEVDSILIDEARTPLIISQPAGESTEKYSQYAVLVKRLTENTHYNKDEKQRTAVLTEEGIKKMEEMLGIENIYTEKGFEEVHHIEQALRAYAIYEKDVDYVVKDGQIIIVDEFTGRLMPGRRYGHGLHQAIEAKEALTVQRESKTLATITFQNFFRLYNKLAGMTGTAKTEAEEFESIYNLRTLVIPTNKPCVRDDKPDAIYKNVASKFKAIARIAKEKYDKGQPILIGTTSIEKSEALSMLLTKEKIPHQILNAKYHEKEAEIVAKAGQKGAVTIATNMAGRGTDIKLGAGIPELGGLVILGTERHESRRIDNQLRGRSGRQGDPGESQFFVSMEDELMRLFGGDRLKSLMESLKVPDDMPLQNRMVSRSIESAQKRVEGRNFDIRRHIVRYDDIMNKHREIIYKRRQNILVKLAETKQIEKDEETANLTESPLHKNVLSGLEKEIRAMLDFHAGDSDSENWNIEEITQSVHALHPVFRETVSQKELAGFKEREQLEGFLVELTTSYYEQKCAQTEPEAVVQAERVVTLQSVDTHWMNHIDEMAHLREQVAFAGFAQRDPLIEYQDQAFQKFRQLLAAIDSTIVHTLLLIDFAQFAPRALLERAAREMLGLQTNVDAIESELTETGAASAFKNQPQNSGSPVIIKADDPVTVAPRQASISQPMRSMPKVGRNDPCPCGSGKKYKKCHGR